MVFEKEKTVSIDPVNSEIAMEIYAKLKELDLKENVMETWLFRPEHVIDVENEVKAIFKVLYSAMMRDDSPTTQSELELEAESDLLDIPTVVNDFIDYTLKHKENTTWEEFVAQFTYLKQQNELI